MDLCHIDIVTEKANVPLGNGRILSLRPEPRNVHDKHAMRVYHGDEHVGYVTRRFNMLAKEEHSRSICHLIPLDQWSPTVWRCAISTASNTGHVYTDYHSHTLF